MASLEFHSQQPSQNVNLAGLAVELSGHTLTVYGQAQINGATFDILETLDTSVDSGRLSLAEDGTAVLGEGPAFALVAWWDAPGVVNAIRHGG